MMPPFSAQRFREAPGWFQREEEIPALRYLAEVEAMQQQLRNVTSF
jgi:hypothetical protein